MALTGELIDPREPVPEWDRFLRQQRLPRAWDAGALATLAAPQRLWCGLVRDGGSVVAVFTGRYRGPGGRSPLVGCFECRVPFLPVPGFAFAADLGAADRRAAIAAFERAMVRRLGRRCLGIAYRQVHGGDLAAVRARRRVRIGTSPLVWLENRWTGLDAYFTWLPRRRRQKFRQLHRRLSADPDLEIEIGAAGIGKADAAEASRLAGLTAARHQHMRAPAAPPAAYLLALSGQDGVLYLTYRDQDGRLLAFLLIFDDGAVLRCSVWGSLDPHGEGRPHIYFDHYVRLVAYAIEHGRSGVNLGKGMAEAKQRFGGVLVPQHLVAGLRPG
jgi:hypothetical protein